MKISRIKVVIATTVLAAGANLAGAQTDSSTASAPSSSTGSAPATSTGPAPTYSTTNVDFSLKTPDPANPGTKITVSPHDLGKQGSATQQPTTVPGVMVTIPFGGGGGKK